ncbi:ParB N-terminal domain-containing protein [Sphingomonas arantia]|uniref:ParB N-terminal domain-containing protein n=1 Tax=Sphingomonas arantia TaxID=1460676 RepID=A0ABW4TVF2_9SPHN
MSEKQITEMELDALVLDLENPRFGLIDAANEAEALGLLAARADLRELWNSINERGFERYEPLVGFQGGDGRYVIVEGNRRLAAVKTLREPHLLSGARVTPPPMTALAEETTRKLPVVVVQERGEADDYIGFKHINGPSTWGALAKAKFAVKLFEKLTRNGAGDDDTRIQHLSKRLGDSRQLILRNLVAYKVFEQALKQEALDAERGADNNLEFSHLYTMLQNPPTRVYLGLTDAPLTEALVKDDPIPDSHREQLAKMMQWLFGSGGQPSVIKRQGTDRPKLQRILSSPSATLTLETTGDFESAADEAGFRTDSWLDQVVRLSTLSKTVADGVTELPTDLDPELVTRAGERLNVADRNVKGATAILRALFS